MGQTIEQVMSRVIESMYERVGDELTVEELARTAMYSKFHFSRMFRRATGVSPGRFLSTLRFQEAKRLLAGTSLSVAEISNRVGYSSLGTFSTRFKRFVGVTPTEYRRGGCWGGDERTAAAGEGQVVALQGRVLGPPAWDCGPIFVGLFPDPVPHGSPVRSMVLSGPGPYLLKDVPEGEWYLLAHGVVLERGIPDTRKGAAPAGSVGRIGPVRVRAGDRSCVGLQDVRLRPMRPVDLPVLKAPFTVRPRQAALAATMGLRAPTAVMGHPSARPHRQPLSAT